MKGYAITLVDLARARCVVIGGGQVAARKVEALCQAGARPVVISPALHEVLRQRLDRAEIEAVERGYQAGDLAGARLVIAATDDPHVNDAVWREAQERGCLVNVVDDPARCNFHLPATVRRGDLLLSVSTGGASPLLARRIREDLDARFDAAYEGYVELLGALRPLVQERIATPARRVQVWQALFDSDLLDLLRAGQIPAAWQRAGQIVDTFR